MNYYHLFKVLPARFTIRDGRTLYTTPFVSDKGTVNGKDNNRRQWMEDMEYFLKHAFYFYTNRKRIYSNSRLFLSKVPVNVGLGCIDDHNATLGCYLEMWEHFQQSVTCDNDGNIAFLFDAVGSPLSGSCSLSVVNEDGKRSIIRTGHLTQYLKMLGNAHNRYMKVHASSWAYSVKQVYDILKAEENGDEHYEQRLRTNTLQLQVRLLAKRQEQIEKENAELKKELHDTRLQLKKDEILAFANSKKEYENLIKDDLEALHEKRLALKREYAGHHATKEFQQFYVPLKQKEHEMRMRNEEEFLAGIRKKWPWGHLTKNKVEQLIEEAEEALDAKRF